MSAWPDQPDHFLALASKRPACGAAPALLGRVAREGGTFAPRRAYAGYLQAVLDDAVAAAVPGVSLQVVHDKALALDPDGDCWTIRLRGGVVRAACTVLALGYKAPRDPLVDNPSFYASPRYVRDAWAGEWLKAIKQDDAVLLIGTGLTMVDMAVALHEQGHRGPLYAVSRHGLSPQGHAVDALPCAASPLQQGDVSASQVMHRLHAEARRALATGEDWRPLVDALQPLTTALWQGFAPRERRRLLRHARPYWDVHRHRIAPRPAAIIAAMRDKGQLTIQAGRLEAFHEREDGVDAVVRPRTGGPRLYFNVAIVVNCTGASLDARQSGSPLVERLRERGLIQPDPMGLGLSSDADGLLLTPSGAPRPPLYAIGPLRQGDLWETTAVPQIRVGQLRWRRCWLARSTPRDVSQPPAACEGR